MTPRTLKVVIQKKRPTIKVEIIGDPSALMRGFARDSLAESVLNLQRALADFSEHYEALISNPEWLIGQRWSEPPKDAA